MGVGRQTVRRARELREADDGGVVEHLGAGLTTVARGEPVEQPRETRERGLVEPGLIGIGVVGVPRQARVEHHRLRDVLLERVERQVDLAVEQERSAARAESGAHRLEALAAIDRLEEVLGAAEVVAGRAAGRADAVDRGGGVAREERVLGVGGRELRAPVGRMRSFNFLSLR